MKIGNKKGQSTLEYIILVTAIIAVMIVFLRPDSEGKLYSTVEGTYNDVSDGISVLGGQLSGTWEE